MICGPRGIIEQVKNRIKSYCWNLIEEDAISYLFKAYDKIKIELREGFKVGEWVSELKKAYKDNDENRIIKINDGEYLSKELFYMIKIEQGKNLE
ncbi:hypothetical protein A8C32_16875 [Flavivirga aquatica]|uniref:Uncharacterized protein n=1 Tax=Flavivirga aquatica TaxID=1849968 RepID=A0A1E5T8F7_9FLAO|nr:hypothetical protein [Flavivirga aquatica]OEK07653.1 hypothetical protein A8C32_16875 [Flavivirga aquatica]